MTPNEPVQPDGDSERDHAAEAEAVRRVLDWITSAGKKSSGDARAIAIARRAVGLACYLYPEFCGSKKATLKLADSIGLDWNNRGQMKNRLRKQFGIK